MNTLRRMPRSDQIVKFAFLIIGVASLHLMTIGTSVALAQDPASVTIPNVTEAIALALEHSAQVTSAQRQLEEAGAGHAAAITGLLGWRLDAHVADRLAKNQTMAAGFLTEDPVNTVSATISLRKALGTGPSTRATLSESNLMIEQTKRALIRAITDTMVETYDAYRQLQLLLLRYDLAKRAANVAEQGSQAAEDQLKAGAIAPTDAQEARLGVVEAQNNVQSARYYLEVAWRRLSHMIGVDPHSMSIDELPVPSLESLWDIISRQDATFWPSNAPISHDSAEQMVQVALENRSEIADAQALISLAEIGVEKIKLDQRPVFQVQAQYAYGNDFIASLGIDNEWVVTTSATTNHFSHEKSPLTLANEEPSWEIGASVTFNLFDSGHQSFARQRGQSALDQALNTLDQAKQRIELDVLSRHANVLTAIDALHLASERALLAHDRVMVEREKQALGMSTELLVDQQKMGLWAAVIDAVSKRFDYETAVLGLKDGQGMNPDLLYEIAKQLSAWDIR